MTLSLLLAGCGASPPAGPEAEPTGSLSGWVVDDALRPVLALVRVAGVGNVSAGADGHYEIDVAWADDKLLVVFESAGHEPASRIIQPTHAAQHIVLNMTMKRLGSDPWTDTTSHNGHIACGVIAQVGHSHGSGSPEDDQHVACPILTGEGRQRIPYLPERDPDDMLIEVYWQAQSRMAQYLTVILYDDQGRLVQFEEGPSPLRLEVGRMHVENSFQDGRSGTIELRAGIAEDDAPGELYVSLFVDQSFDVFATTSHGMDLPAGWSIQ